jgi:hypothetical protein
LARRNEEKIRNRPVPRGPGAVHYDFGDLEGHAFEGELTWASLLTNIDGFGGPPVDLLVLRTMPEETCRPKAKVLLPLDSVWFLKPLSPDLGTHPVVGGPMPDQMSAKTWTWADSQGQSHNLAIHGTFTVDSRTATTMKGRVDLRATPYFQDATIGTLEGPFEAQIIDCANWTGGFPL